MAALVRFGKPASRGLYAAAEAIVRVDHIVQPMVFGYSERVDIQRDVGGRGEEEEAHENEQEEGMAPVRNRCLEKE